ncbi:MAG: hypothetical protein CNIPEHKO_02186 [Anaerolineales bacterium]|nr:hypothetical protein [Anaerolineales bacterium]
MIAGGWIRPQDGDPHNGVTFDSGHFVDTPILDLALHIGVQGTNKVAYMEKWKPSDVDNAEYVAGSALKV